MHVRASHPRYSGESNSPHLEQRPRFAQYPCAPKIERAVQRRPAENRHENGKDVHKPGDHGPGEMRRTFLDGVLHRRAGSSLLCGYRFYRLMRTEASSSGGLHDFSLAREIRTAGAAGLAGRRREKENSISVPEWDLTGPASSGPPGPVWKTLRSELHEIELIRQRCKSGSPHDYKLPFETALFR